MRSVEESSATFVEAAFVPAFALVPAFVPAYPRNPDTFKAVRNSVAEKPFGHHDESELKLALL